jgi:hypothetical protein
MSTLLDHLTESCRTAAGGRARVAGKRATAELVKLVVRHWPHAHLRDLLKRGGKNHATLDHAMLLVRAQVREHWEARHGVGPMWAMVHQGLVSVICHVLAESWFRDPLVREPMKRLSRDISMGLDDESVE